MNGSLSKQDEKLNAFDVAIEFLLILLILTPPLALGAVSPWARNAVFIMSCCLLALWCLNSAWSGSLKIVVTGFWPFALVFVSLAVAQIVPLPPQIVKIISPGAYETYREVFSQLGVEERTLTLSLSPYSTKVGLIRFITLCLIFFVLVNSMTRRWQVKGILIAVLILAGFEVVYGFKEMLSLEPHIFWLPRRYNLDAVTGTFHNKNHFAGLLEMIFPATLGFLFAMGRGRILVSQEAPLGRRPWRQRFVDRLSAFSTYGWLLVAMLSVLVAVGILFSLSRAGILSAVISVLCFIAFAAKRAGFRSHTVALLIIILGVFSVAASIGVQMVIHVTKEAVTGESTSWLDRFDLNRSGLVFFKEFFLVGSGLGTFGSVFPRFQSARFGDRWADFLHNDWLQLFCEMGVVGGGVLLVGLGRLVHGLIKKSRHVRDPFCLWVGFGCLVGVMSILLHSFFDYNLGKVNSNAVLFTVLLGMCFVLFQLGSPENREASGSGRVVIRLRGRGFLRASVAVAGTCVLPAAWIIGVPGIVADLQFNGYLSVHPNAGKPDDYFFLPTGLLPAAGADGLREAIKAEPENPVYWFAEARCIVGSVKEEIRKRAESDAYRALNMGSAREGIAVQLPNEVVEAFSRDLWSRMGETLSSSLVTAAASLRKAIELCPTVAEYHVLLTDLLLHVDGGAREAIREAEVAGWLAPNKPSVLFQAGKTFLIAGVSGAVTQYTVAESIEKAYMCFRKVLYSDPAYAYRVFELVTAWQGDKADLLAITPLRTRARESLARWLEERWDWKVLLVALEQMDGMVGTSVDDVTNSGHPAEERAKGVRQVSEEAPPGKGSRAYDGRPPDEVLLSIVGKRCFALGALNEWRMRGIEIARYRKLVRAQMDRLVEEAIMLQESGRMREAIGLYMEILDKDWSNPRALLGIAEAMKAGDGGVWEMADETNPLDYLYRLLVYDEPLDKQVVEKARRCAVGLNGSTPGVRVLKEFLIAGFCLKAGEFDRTIQLLSSLANEPEEVLKSWRQYHQIWYLLGKACEAVGDLSMACQSYQKVVEIVPTHMAALRKLASLREERDEAVHTTLRQLVPAVECDVTYGGKLVWLGYTLGKEKDTRVGEMTYYWEFLDGFDASYQPAVHFCDAGGRILFQNDHRIMTGNGPYWVDFPRTGEVVVERYGLGRDPMEAEYMRVGLFSQDGTKGKPQWMLADCGTPWILTSLRPGSLAQ